MARLGFSFIVMVAVGLLSLGAIDLDEAPLVKYTCTRILPLGKSLYWLAQRYDYPLDKLMEENEIADPTKVPAGKRVVLNVEMPRISYGRASWYGLDFVGRPTSSGEIYDMFDFTAAHKIIDHDTFVRVVNLDNGKDVEVRINDRGPYIPGRVIDLSYAAARELGIINSGVANVRIEILEGG